MNSKELVQRHAELCKRMNEICAAKNADYTGGSADPFSNFSTVEGLGITDGNTGILVRMTDKFKRIITFVKTGQYKVKDESVEDTLMDFANYCLLLLLKIQHDKETAVSTATTAESPASAG